MVEYICILFAISSLASFVICLLDKWKFVEWVQINGNDFFAKMFSCHFCLSWWTNVIICILTAIALRDAYILLFPFLATNITKHLL